MGYFVNIEYLFKLCYIINGDINEKIFNYIFIIFSWL